MNVFNNRKVFLINKRFQLTFLAYMLGFCLLTIGIFYSADLYFFYKFSALGKNIGLPTDHVFFQFIQEQRREMNFLFFTFALVETITLSIFGLFLSHRVAGPVHHLVTHMRAVADGQTPSRIKFRSRDFFPELAEMYNVQLESLLSRLGSTSVQDNTSHGVSSRDKKKIT